MSFAFEQLDNPQARGFVGDTPPRALAERMHAAWVAFATNGDPNHAGLPDWPRYDVDRRPVMLLDETCEVTDRPAAEEVALWDGVI